MDWIYSLGLCAVGADGLHLLHPHTTDISINYHSPDDLTDDHNYSHTLYDHPNPYPYYPGT